MKFFFPDSQDQVDPGFHFVTEERDPFRVRQRDDLYAHEVLSQAPFDGLLVSKAIVDGTAGGTGKYTAAQRHRLYREGARHFFRLDHGHTPLEIMGDCGAFSYVAEEYPPYSVDEVIDFYDGCGFHYGIAVDHVIFQYEPKITRDDKRAEEWVRRQDITLDLAEKFWQRCKARRVSFTPLGVAQGWSPQSYADAVKTLERIGYQRIALGGMVPLKTPEILACLDAIDQVRDRDTTRFHLLGVSRCDDVRTFADYGVTSFDSTSPFRQAFKDDRDNYYTPTGTYVALRVPQVDGNAKLKARIRSGEISQGRALELERTALTRLRQYDADEIDIDPVVHALQEYSAVWDGKSDRSSQYRATLTDRPWRACPCDLCKTIGIEIVIFRGSERNKRRGFHNLYVFEQRLRAQQGRTPRDQDPT